MAATPNLAEAGRSLAGQMRRRRQKAVDPELIPQATVAPVVIVGMGAIGRTVADALIEFNIEYFGIERDQRRLREAIADGYAASFGDAADTRLWESVELHNRKVSVLTAPRLDVVSANSPVAAAKYPNLKRIAIAADEAQARLFHDLGITAVIEQGTPLGRDIAAAVLAELGCDPAKVAQWTRQLNGRALERAAPPAVAAA
jgi:CPA2 family monovalent cation:H+ antiporter-2